MALTDREFWLNYWENHRAEVTVPVAPTNLFTPLTDKLLKEKPAATTCELGGFPGTFSVYLKQRHQVKPTLVDYVIHREILSEFLKVNQLTDQDLQIIEADIFQYTPTQTFDFVFSVGLIEHFENTREVIDLHLKYMKPGSRLLILIPNFTGLNGWFQRKFDRGNYDKHVISCMDPKLLRQHFESLGLTNIEAGYYAKFGIWLENEASQPAHIKLFKKMVWFCGKIFFKIFPIETKAFSPYIQISGILPDR